MSNLKIRISLQGALSEPAAASNPFLDEKSSPLPNMFKASFESSHERMSYTLLLSHCIVDEATLILFSVPSN